MTLRLSTSHPAACAVRPGRGPRTRHTRHARCSRAPAPAHDRRRGAQNPLRARRWRARSCPENRGATRGLPGVAPAKTRSVTSGYESGAPRMKFLSECLAA